MYNSETAEVKQFATAKVSPKHIWQEAVLACRQAVKEFTDKHGEPMYCGFANVKIRPARGNFVKFLKAEGIGSNGYNGGWRISYYDMMGNEQYSHTQSMDIKEHGCDAFAEVLNKYGMDAHMESRAD
jgi:hypothetical protein|tara:strand:+ start:2227 stop:2607 length:381 start_codon:yes stop_codon:yes gene_type:complete